MHIPSEFADALHREFDGRFRVRWSPKREEYHVEYKVLPGQVLEPPRTKSGEFDTYDDDYIRARDGYDFIVAIRRGDRMPCPHCGLTMKVAHLEMREASCEHCKVRGRDGRYPAVFYPLNHILIEHLRFIDPLRGGPERVLARVRELERQRELAEFRSAMNEIEDATSAYFTRLFDIKSVGYTGKERYL